MYTNAQLALQAAVATRAYQRYPNDTTPADIISIADEYLEWLRQNRRTYPEVIPEDARG